MCAGLEKDGRSSSAMDENEPLDEEDDDDEDEGGAETEEQSGNESEMNEPEEEVTLLTCVIDSCKLRLLCYSHIVY